MRRDDGTWLIDGAVPIDDVRSRLGLGERWGVEQSGYNTLAGLVMTQLGHVPGVGEHFVLDGFRFEVVDMDGRRIDRVLISPVTPDGTGL